MTRLVVIFLFFAFSSYAEASMWASPPYDTPPIKNIDTSFLVSTDEETSSIIRNYVMRFNFNEYAIHLIPNLGLFFLEKSGKVDWIKDILRKGICWETYITPLIYQYAKPGTLALDIGSHIGTHTLDLARAVGATGKVFAFEPQPKTICELFMNSQLNGAKNIYCFWAALGDKIGTVHLPNFHPEVEVAYLYDFTYGDSGNVAPMITLDSLNLENISFMKVDVDGCDDIFLDGAKETILRNKPVMVIEIMGGVDINTATEEQAEKIQHTMKKIKDLGYELKQLYIHDYLATPLINQTPP